MAQNYKQMSTKKLNSLLVATKDEAEKAKIQEVLNARQAATAPKVLNTEKPSTDDELSPEEKAAIDAATANDATATTKKPKKEPKAKMTDDERKALADKLRIECVNHKCQVVPFNSINWIDGVIVSIIEEKRTSKVLYAVKTDDGRRIVKAYGSELIKIFDETVEPEKRAHRTSPNEEKAEWTPDEIKAAVDELTPNVGKLVSYVETGALGKEIEGAKTLTGRIVSLVPNKRAHTILYRIELISEDGEATKKYAHKISTSKALVIEDTLDEEGQKINAAFVKRHSGEKASFGYTSKTPEEKLAFAKDKLAKFEAKLVNVKESIAKWQNEIVKLGQELNINVSSADETSTNTNTNETDATDATDTTDATGTNDDGTELM